MGEESVGSEDGLFEKVDLGHSIASEKRICCCKWPRSVLYENKRLVIGGELGLYEVMVVCAQTQHLPNWGGDQV